MDQDVDNDWCSNTRCVFLLHLYNVFNVVVCAIPCMPGVSKMTRIVELLGCSPLDGLL